MPVDVIKNFDTEDAVNFIANTFNQSCLFNRDCTLNFDTIEKLIEVIDKNEQLFERLLQSERKKNGLLQRMIEGKKGFLLTLSHS